MHFVARFFSALILSSFLISQATAKDQIVAVYADNYPPYSHGKGSDVEGVLVDLINKVFREDLGYEVVHTGMPWKRAQELVKLGEADVIIATPTPTRLGFARLIVTPAIRSSIVPVVSIHDDQASAMSTTTDVDALSKDTVFCQSLGNDWQKTFYEMHKLKATQASSLTACLKMVAMDRMSVTYADRLVANFYAKQQNISDKLRILNLPSDYMTTMNLMISKKSFLNTDPSLRLINETLKRQAQIN